MNIIKTSIDNTITVRFENVNKLTASDSAELNNTLTYSLEHSNNIIVDFTNVNYIDSSILNELLTALDKSQQKNKQFALTGLSSKIKDILKITKLDEVFEVVD